MIIWYLGAKGDVAALAKGIGLSEGRVRDGYELWGKLPFSVKGSLENPDFSSLQSFALKMLQGKAVSGLLGEGSRKSDKPTQNEQPQAVDAVQELKRQATELLDGFLNGL